jgi:hypothetical protein
VAPRSSTYPAIVDDQRVRLAGDHRVVTVDARTGSSLWELGGDGAVTAPIAATPTPCT